MRPDVPRACGARDVLDAAMDTGPSDHDWDRHYANLDLSLHHSGRGGGMASRPLTGTPRPSASSSGTATRSRTYRLRGGMQYRATYNEKLPAVAMRMFALRPVSPPPIPASRTPRAAGRAYAAPPRPHRRQACHVCHIASWICACCSSNRLRRPRCRDCDLPRGPEGQALSRRVDAAFQVGCGPAIT